MVKLPVIPPFYHGFTTVLPKFIPGADDEVAIVRNICIYTDDAPRELMWRLKCQDLINESLFTLAVKLIKHLTNETDKTNGIGRNIKERGN